MVYDVLETYCITTWGKAVYLRILAMKYTSMPEYDEYVNHLGKTMHSCERLLDRFCADRIKILEDYIREKND